jgi:hypothetical protein
MSSSELLEKVEILRNILISHATGQTADDAEYRAIRKELMSNISISSLLPRFVKTCRDLAEFWSYIQPNFASYRERRSHIRDEFQPLLENLEANTISPVDKPVSDLFKQFGAEYINQIWQRNLERRIDDPEGAITSAKTFLESVCKHILDDMGVSYTQNHDLPKLYRLTSEQLNLAPDQHTEEIFKRILGGCQSVVEGLGAVRNKLGDAHGKGRQLVKPAPRHAELAVNLAGSMATFLIRTWEHQQAK